MPTEGPEHGNLQQFLAVTAGVECASFEFLNDERSRFVSAQHPGEGGTVEEPLSNWPYDGTNRSRPTVIQVWHEDGEKIGGDTVPPGPIR